MGERSRIMKSKRRMRLYSFIAAAGLALLGALLIGINVLTSDKTVERGISPSPVDERAAAELQESARQEAAYMANARQAAAEAAREAAAKEAAEKRAAEERAASRESDSQPQAAVPPDTTMYLTIPAIGLQDVLVQDGTSEPILTAGVGHVPGTGFPWVEGSNTYIAGHRIGYPGTGSDLVFWDLPSLGAGDEIILEDSLGQTYTYYVTEVLEVSPYDLSVTAPTGGDIVSLQTCIEDYGDYWTAGPNWLARYIVRAEKAS
jgi:sortase A